MRQDNYVRPNFPPLYSEKPPAPFPEALKETRKPESDKELFETSSKCEVNIPLLKLDKELFDVFEGKLTMEFDGDKIEHNIHDANSMNLSSVCWIDATIPPDKENLESNLLDDPPDMIADFSVSSDDLHAHVSPLTTVLGIRPTLLTPQSKSFVSVIEQVVEKKRKHPPERSKYGGGQKKRMVRQVWRATIQPSDYG